MKRADSVLESLRRGTFEQNFQDAATRLEDAIRHGEGHIVVLGDSQHEAAVFVGTVIDRVSGYDVAQISARRLDLPKTDAEPDHNILLVVHDADVVSATALERLRMAVERIPGTAHFMRLVLIGTTHLEQALAQPEGRALASRVQTHIRLVRKAEERHPVRVIPRNTSRRWALKISAVTACTAIALIAFAEVATTRQTNPMLASLGEKLAKVERAAWDLVPAAMPSRKDKSSSPSKANDSAPAAESSSSVSQATAPSAAPKSTSSTARSNGGGGFVTSLMETATYAAVRTVDVIAPLPAAAPASSVKPARVAARRPSPAPSRVPVAYTSVGTRLAAALSRLFISDSSGRREIATGGAVLETALMGSRSRSRSVVQVGSFNRANSAFGLKSSLAKDFDRLAVARFDPPSGPVYSVRIFDFAGEGSAEVAATSNSGDAEVSATSSSGGAE